MRRSKYQTNRASEWQLRAWFGNGSNYGVAVVFGPISGGLGSRDYDTMPAYESWAAEHPDLAGVLPTVETSRGRHVYFRAAPGSMEAIRRRLGKHGTGAIHFADGELRAGCGGYSVAPPSRHPSGHVYRWLLIPPGEEIPTIDLESAFLAPCNIEGAENIEISGGHRRSDDIVGGGCNGCGGFVGDPPFGENTPTCSSSSPSALPSQFDDQITKAIIATTPQGLGRRHRLLFDLARELKAIPGLADATLAE